MKIFLTIASILIALVLLGWLGLKVKPAAFAPFPQESPALETIPLPAGLPAPVERFYRTVYGEQIPVIRTVVIKGRADISPFGFKLPARFLFVHNAGKDYRHYIEATWFGLPLMKVNESFVDGHSRFELPVGPTIEDDASITQAANLGLWAEANWFPAIYLTDPRVHWEPVDENTALLFVPSGEKEENFVVRFDPQTGLLTSMEAMRFRDAGAAGEEDPVDHAKRAGANHSGDAAQCGRLGHLAGPGQTLGGLYAGRSEVQRGCERVHPSEGPIGVYPVTAI